MASSILGFITSTNRLYVPFVLTCTGVSLDTIYKILTIGGKKNLSVISYGKFRVVDWYKGKGKLILLVEFYLEGKNTEEVNFKNVEKE